ncbi:hypothetical protein TI05_15030, partial [Achromatium sp. WMS3]
MQKLPIGIQSFAKIRKGNYCYVDKTALIAQLANKGGFYFLARPRRFGKSLLIDTIAAAFEGNKTLFNGLYLENNWDWYHNYPIIKIDLAESILTSRERLDEKLNIQLTYIAKQYKIILQYQESSDRLHELIQTLYEQTQQPIVVLIDEYDKPILDNITRPDRACELLEGLKNFYSVLKTQDAYLRFVMLTGVSKFSKVSLFSGLNHLQDISLDYRYGNICGYTQAELENVFVDYLEAVDLKQLKHWYNGYNFLADTVYNPFDVLLYLDLREFKPYWFETGTPSFLIDLIHNRKLTTPSLESIDISDAFMDSFDIDTIEPEPLLFQTGYLTITKKVNFAAGSHYTLGFPNYEVHHAFHNAVLTKLTQSGLRQDKQKFALIAALQCGNIDELRDIFHAFFASIPADWYRKNDIAGYEGYYCSVVYSYFVAAGLDIRTEDITNHGRIDMSVLLEDTVFIIEFKVTELNKPGRALLQIKEKRYADKYYNKNIWL